MGVEAPVDGQAPDPNKRIEIYEGPNLDADSGFVRWGDIESFEVISDSEDFGGYQEVKLTVRGAKGEETIRGYCLPPA